MPDNTTDFIQQIDTLNSRAWSLRFNAAEEAIIAAKEALGLAEKYEYEKGKVYAKMHIAICDFLLSKLNDSVLKYLTEAKNYFEENNDQEGLSKALNFIGNVYDSYGQYEKGLSNCMNGLKIAEEINYSEGIGDTLSTIGNIYFRLGDTDKALQSYKRSLLIREETQNVKAAASSMNLIARVYTSKNDFENGLNFYQQSLKLRESVNDQNAIPWTYLGLASLFEKKHETKIAFDNYSKALKLNERLNDKRLKLLCLIGIIKIYLQEKKADEGIAEATNALTIANELNAIPLVYEVHLLMAELYEASNNAENAFKHFKEFHKLKEQVLNAESNNRLKNQQISFAVEQSEKEAEILRTKNNELHEAYQKLKEAQDKLVQSEKMAAFGIVASRVAHEIQNPLNFVNNFSDISAELITEFSDAENESERKSIAGDLKEMLQKINHHGKRADKIVKELLEHTRAGTTQQFFEDEKK